MFFMGRAIELINHVFLVTSEHRDNHNGLNPFHSPRPPIAWYLEGGTLGQAWNWV